MFRTFRLARFFAPCYLALAAASLAPGAENTKKPISRERLFRAVEIGGLSNDEFIGILRDFGVEFEMSADDKANLRKAGVDDAVISAIAANYRDPLREKVSQLAEGGPLSKENIVGLLKAGAGSDIIEVMVEKRGVAFAMSPNDAKEIETAGGNKALLGTLLLKEPKMPVKEAVKEVKEPALVAAATPAAVVVPQAATPAPTPQQSAPPPVVQQQTAPPPTPAPAPQQAATAPKPTSSQPINQAAAILTSTAKPAKLISGKVAYTEVARRANAQGKVIMEIVINEQGRVEQVKGLAGNPLLIMSATQSLREWLYEPATVDGHPTKVTTQVTVTFQ